MATTIPAHSHYLSKINTGKTRTKKGISATSLLPNYTVIQSYKVILPMTLMMRSKFS